MNLWKPTPDRYDDLIKAHFLSMN